MPTDHTPQPKVAQVGIAGAMTTILFWLLSLACIQVPKEWVPPVTTLISLLAGYWTVNPGGPHPSPWPTVKIWAAATAGLLTTLIVPWIEAYAVCKTPPSLEVQAAITATFTAAVMFAAGYLVPEDPAGTGDAGAAAQQEAASGTK